MKKPRKAKGLATIDVGAEIGRFSAERIMARIDGAEESPQRIVHRPSLLIRESSAGQEGGSVH